MTARLKKSVFWTIARAVFVLLLLAGIILSGRFTHFWDAAGFAFVFGGGIALVLMGFSPPEIGAALRFTVGRAPREGELLVLPYLWEALGRNFWVVGVLGTIANFVLTLGKTSEGIQQMFYLMTASFRPSLYGLFLAVVCAVPAMKAREELERREEASRLPAGAEGRRPWTFGNAPGYVILAAILGGTIILPAARGFLHEQRLLGVFFDPSALLIVVGGAVILVLYLERKSIGVSLTSGLAVIGLLGSLMGLMQTLFAFTKKSITDVSSALSFVISSCFLALLGMILFGLPLADHEAGAFPRPKGLTFSRLAWYIFPLLALLFLVLTLIAVVTPIKI